MSHTIIDVKLIFAAFLYESMLSTKRNDFAKNDHTKLYQIIFAKISRNLVQFQYFSEENTEVSFKSLRSDLFLLSFIKPSFAYVIFKFTNLCFGLIDLV